MNRREFHATISAGVLQAAATDRTRGRSTSPDEWYESLTPGIHLDYHFPEWDPYILSKAEGAPMIQRMAATGAELVVVFAKCHYGNAYYNTRVGHKHKNLGDKDLLQEWIAEARRKKLRVLAYYSVDRDLWAGHLHPEWRMRDPQGRLVDEDRYPPEWAAMGFLCYNSPYRDYVRQQVEELLDYDIDGFHFDMLWFGHTGKVCYCEYCKPLFRKAYGIDMPQEHTWDNRWAKFLDFRYESNTRFCQELRSFIRSKRPALSVMYNYHGTPPNSWQEGMLPVKHRLISDYGTGEGYPMRLGHHYASFMSCFLSNLEPGSPWQGVTSRYTRNMSDKTVRPLADMTWESMTYLSHGGMPLLVDTPQDDGFTLDPAAYERMGALLHEVREKKPLFGHEPFLQVGLYFSARTRDWYGRDDPQRYFRSFAGAHRILVESHIPVAFLFDENISLERLKQFPLIFLANTAVLTPSEQQLFRNYVSNGGRLIATLDTSRFDELGQERDNFSLADLFGADFSHKTEFRTNYFRMPSGFMSRGFRPDWDVLTMGPNNVVKQKSASCEGELRIAFHDRGLHTHIGHAPNNSPWRTVGPGLVRNHFGRGEVLYIPFSAEAAYLSDYPLPEHRMFIANAVRSLLPQPAIDVVAPLNVESVIRRDASRNGYIVHFIAFIGVRDGQSQTSAEILVPLMEQMWRYRARILLTTPARHASAHSPETVVKAQGNAVEIETQQIHEAVSIDL